MRAHFFHVFKTFADRTGLPKLSEKPVTVLKELILFNQNSQKNVNNSRNILAN